MQLPGPAGRITLGLVWGLVPCALVYSVLPLALFAGGPWQGAAVMLAFGLGTLPNLAATGLLFDRAKSLFERAKLRRAAAVLLAHSLGKAGWLINVRGKGGGLELAGSPDSINLGQVVRLTEGPARPAECFNHATNKCCITPVCKLRTVLDDAMGAFYAVLDKYTLDDITQNRSVLARILSMPRPARPQRAA